MVEMVEMESVCIMVGNVRTAQGVRMVRFVGEGSGYIRWRMARVVRRD